MTTNSVTQYHATFSEKDMDLIRRTVAKDATSDELTMFLLLCHGYDLDPFRRELVFQKRSDGTVTFITTRDGYLKAAMRNPGYAGLQSMPVKEGDEFSIDPIKGEVVHRFGAKRGKLIGAWAIAFHRERPPIIAWADYPEYAAANPTSQAWVKYPSAMIQKVAEVAALRRQFNLSGLVAKEEIDLDRDEKPHAQARPTPTSTEAPGMVVDVAAFPVPTPPAQLGTAQNAAPAQVPVAKPERSREDLLAGIARLQERARKLQIEIPTPAEATPADQIKAFGLSWQNRLLDAEKKPLLAEALSEWSIAAAEASELEVAYGDLPTEAGVATISVATKRIREQIAGELERLEKAADAEVLP